jgi:hypothetical protein
MDPKVMSRQRYLKQIDYGNRVPSRKNDTWEIDLSPKSCLFSVLFDYGEHDMESPSLEEKTSWNLRSDPFTSCRAGFQIRTLRLCQRMLLFHNIPERLHIESSLVGSTQFFYETSPQQSLLKAIKHTGYVPFAGGGERASMSLPKQTFAYSVTRPADDLRSKQVNLNQFQTLPSFHDRPNAFWVDLYGEGLTGLLCDTGDNRWTYQRNSSSQTNQATWDSPIELWTHPAFPSHVQSAAHFADLGGSNGLDMVVTDADNVPEGYYTYEKTGWSSFAFLPNKPCGQDKRLRWHEIDLTGNGIVDRVSFDPSTCSVLWYESRGKDGYHAQKQTHVKTTNILTDPMDAAILVSFADLSGDGLQDLVRVTQNNIRYWPNCGYGTFGHEIVMQTPPVFDDATHFDVDRLRFADVNGTGTCDLLYFPRRGGVHIYYNQAGNGWSAPQVLTDFPALTRLSAVAVLDIFGNGTSCISWIGTDSSTGTASFFYLDPMRSMKPNLLLSCDNGLGRQKTFEYTPSSTFRARDETRGRPWVTRLPFPVQCISQTYDTDTVSGVRTIVQYEYHDGFYDGIEREFCGFGSVEVTTTDLLHHDGRLAQQLPSSRRLIRYYLGTEATGQQPVTSVSANHMPPSINPENSRRAFRALKGKILQEQILNTDPKAEKNPILRKTTYAYNVTSVGEQPSTSQPEYPVFGVAPREQVTEYHERDSEYPRVEHTLYYQFNSYGRPTRVTSIKYGNSHCELEDERAAVAQQTSRIECTEHLYANAIDEIGAYRVTESSGSTTYAVELHKNDWSDIVPWEHSAAETTSIWDDIVKVLSLPPELNRTNALIKATRTIFWSGDLERSLPPGQLDLFSTVYRTYELVTYTATLRHVYRKYHFAEEDEIKEAMLAGGYINLDNDGAWWTTSTLSLYHEDNRKQLQAARTNFYSRVLHVDSFGNKTNVKLDDLSLYVAEVEDSLANKSSWTVEYTYFQVYQHVDINGNVDIFSHDALGSRNRHIRIPKDGIQQTLSEPYYFCPVAMVGNFLKNPTTSQARELVGAWDSITLNNYELLGRDDGAPTTLSLTTAKITRISGANRMAHQQDAISVTITHGNGSGGAFQLFRLDDQQDLGLQRWLCQVQDIETLAGATSISYQQFEAPTSVFIPIKQLTAPHTNTYYDALGRSVATVYPDCTWSKTVYNVWSTTEWDAGDTISIIDPNQDLDVGHLFAQSMPTWSTISKATPTATAQSLVYANTTTTTHIDCSQQKILTTARGRDKCLSIRTEYDLATKRILSFDAMNRLVESNTYDLLRRNLYKATMDSGERWFFHDCQNQDLITWNSRGIKRVYGRDSLRRHISTIVSVQGGNPVQVEQTIWGEAAPMSKGKNLRGQVYKKLDQSGLQVFDDYDLRGNCRLSMNQLTKEYQGLFDVTETSVLEDTVFMSSTTYDSLGRSIVSVNAVGMKTYRTFDAIGNLKAVWTEDSPGAEQIVHLKNPKYSAFGHMISAEMGEGILIRYDYDSRTQRMIGKQTMRRSDGRPKKIEEKRYEYDCLGRKVSEVNTTVDDAFIRNSRIAARTDLTYDSFGRLVRCRGRENVNNAIASSGEWGLPLLGRRQQTIVDYVLTRRPTATTTLVACSKLSIDQ